MSQTIDLTPAILHLKVQAGSDVKLTLTFGESIAGWIGWEGIVKPYPAAAGPIEFAIDASQQASNIIAISLSAVQTLQIRNGSEWQFRVEDPDGKEIYLFKGDVVVDADYFE